MAKVGYIMAAECYEALEANRKWMKDFGCCTIIEEEAAHEKLRPLWKDMLSKLERGDVLVVGKLSNAVRDVRGLSCLIEICRLKMLRLISIGDKIDTGGELFPETTPADVLQTIGSLPHEAIAMRRAAEHVRQLKQRNKPKTSARIAKIERNKLVVSMYKSGQSIDDIWQKSGFHSRSSVFRILNDAGVSVTRGRIKKNSDKDKGKGKGKKKD